MTTNRSYPELELAYTADGVEHVLQVPWEIAMCGTEVNADVTPSC